MNQYKIKVAYIINYAPNYRDVFLKELGKYVDLTVLSFNGRHVNLKDPLVREGYKFIELKQRRLFNISFCLNEFFKIGDKYDVIIIGYNLRNPFRIMNLFRRKRVIVEGLIYGKNNNWLIRLVRKIVLNNTEGILVYSDFVKKKLINDKVKTPIISFNNTHILFNEIQKLEYKNSSDKLNIIWVGRYQPHKKIETLIEYAKFNHNVSVKLIGPGLPDRFADIHDINNNIETLDAQYGEKLDLHFETADIIFCPGGAGLLVMYAGKYSRPIVIDKDSYHGPEIQLAIESKQQFINFNSFSEIDRVVDYYSDRAHLEKDGDRIYSIMRDKYTVEYMATMYLKAINNNWN